MSLTLLKITFSWFKRWKRGTRVAFSPLIFKDNLNCTQELPLNYEQIRTDYMICTPLFKSVAKNLDEWGLKLVDDETVPFFKPRKSSLKKEMWLKIPFCIRLDFFPHTVLFFLLLSSYHNFAKVRKIWYWTSFLSKKICLYHVNV